MRSIAILRDGYSDYLVIKKFVSVLLEKHRNEVLDDNSFIDLEILNIRNSLLKYIDKVSISSNYSFQTKEAQDLINELLTIYFVCYSKFANESFDINNRSIIIINTDAEKLLHQRQNYFNEWAYNLKGILYYSIERFYEVMVSRGYSYELLPYYIPLVPFPSSEIIVASCMYNITTENLRSFRPTPALKQKVYDTNSIPEAIQSGNLIKTLNTYLNSGNINEIYKEIPEARMLIHNLSN
jgi:hypothetical protein